MGFLNRLFGKPPSPPPLPPLDDSVFGRLTWNSDSEGWTGSIVVGGKSALLYVGAGTESEYPSEEILHLLREPYDNFEDISRVALSYLLRHAVAAINQLGARTGSFRVDALESYAHYVPEGTYTVTLSDGESEVIWKVHFQHLQPTDWGFDD